MEFVPFRSMVSLKSESADEVLEEEALGDNEISPLVSYEVSSYGADPEVEVLVNRLNRAETEADKEEFVRGIVGLNKGGERKAAAGFIAGYLLSKALRKNG